MGDVMRTADVDNHGRVGRTPSTEVARALLTAGGNLLAQEGLNGLTLRALTATSGVARSGVYSRFGGMDGLIDALLIRAFADLAAVCDRCDLVDPYRRLWEGLIAYRQWATANPRLYEVMFMVRPGPCPGSVAAAVRAWFTVLVRHVEYAIAAGILTAESPTEAAHQLLSAAHGATSLELRGLVLTEEPETAYLDTLRMLLRGLTPPPTRRQPVERAGLG